MKKTLSLLVCSFFIAQSTFANDLSADPFLKMVKKSQVSNVGICRQEINGFRDPQICYMTIGAAAEYCLLKNSSLPTVREIAAWATRNGAKGILEISTVQNELDGQVPPGYQKIHTLEADGTADNFYYSHEGYKPSVSSEKVSDTFKTLWTSSKLARFPLSYYVLSAYGALGVGFDGMSYFPTAVACK